MSASDLHISDDGLLLTYLGNAKAVVLKTPRGYVIEVREYPLSKIVEVTPRRRTRLAATTWDGIERLANRALDGLSTGAGMLVLGFVLTVAAFVIEFGVVLFHGGAR